MCFRTRRSTYGKSEKSRMNSLLFVHYKQHKEKYLYLVTGGLTTLISFAFYAIFTRVLHWKSTPSNFMALIISVLFAYYVSRRFVQECKTTGKALGIEAIAFITGRLLTAGFDLLTLYLLVEVFSMPDIICKIFVNVLVIILNYGISRVFVFRKGRV